MNMKKVFVGLFRFVKCCIKHAAAQEQNTFSKICTMISKYLIKTFNTNFHYLMVFDTLQAHFGWYP